MTIQLRRALFALALGFSLPLPAQIWAAPDQIAPATATLRAVVFDTVGQPIEGADVVVVQRGDDDEVRATALVTDAQGRFELSRLEPKFAVEAFVHAPGLALQRVYLTSKGDNQITLKTGAMATGKVVDANGKPVAGARVVMTRLALSADDATDLRFRSVMFDSLGDSVLKRALEAQTDANGVWELTDLPVGSAGLFGLEDPRFARDDKFGVPGETKQTVPDLKATPGANLKGRVVAPDGKPVAGARINVNVGEKSSSYASTQTAPDGTYALQSLPAGDAVIKVKTTNSDWAPTSIKGVAVAAGQTATAPEIRLDAGVLLTGKVVDKESKAPIEGASVMAMGDFGNAPSTATSKDGIYKVRVPTGQIRFLLYARPAEYVREMFADAKANITLASTNAPNFAVQRGLTLTGTARDQTGAPATNANIIAGAFQR